MILRITGISGLLTGLLFVVGFSGLFFLNPQTYEELNNLSLTAYNIPGMNARIWAVIVVYGLTGMANIIFCLSLLFNKPYSSISRIGIVLLTVCGVLWFSFAVVPFNPTQDISFQVLLGRLTLLLMACVTAFFMLAGDYVKIANQKILRPLTLLVAVSILLLSFLSVFVYNDDSWIRINISLILYFGWITAYGVKALLSSYYPSLP